MGKMKNYLIDVMNETDDYVDDSDYFRLLTESEWQHECEKKQNELIAKCGMGTHYKLRLIEWKINNNIK